MFVSIHITIHKNPPTDTIKGFRPFVFFLIAISSVSPSLISTARSVSKANITSGVVRRENK